MKTFSVRTVRPLCVVALGLVCSLLVSCVRLGKQDAFPVAGRVPSAAVLGTLAKTDSEVRPFEISAGDRRVGAYYVSHPDARGVVVFFGGSGNDVESALKVLAPRTADLGLDLVVFSYYRQGEEIPSVTQVRAEAKAVCAAVRAMHTPASHSLYLLGHSLGGWFALDAAANENVRGLVLAGAETTPAEVIRKTDAPWAYLVALRPDADARQLDASLYAPHVCARTLVVTSDQDEAVPASVGREIFKMLPSGLPKRLVVLEGVSHGRYFLTEKFWQQFAEFLGLARKTGARPI